MTKIVQWFSQSGGSASWITPSLLACSYPDGDDDLAALASEGISLLVNLHTRPHPSKQAEAHGIRELHLPTRDFTPPEISDVAAGVAEIERTIAAGRRVAVHCGAGLGRTGTLVACYLVRTGMAAQSAIDAVRRARPGSIETADQEALVRKYESMLRGDRTQ